MSKTYEKYRNIKYRLPEVTQTWNLYGAGVENMGRQGEPETMQVPQPGDDQLLVRIDSVGVCFSDVKILNQGGSHPKLYNRNLAVDPTRLGHEVSLTVVRVGKNLQARYSPGKRLAVQPDIYQNGKSTAYGYTIPGGLIQYHLIGPEVLETDAGACLLPLEDEMGYAESSLLEPWGCVVAAYTQRRRLEPLPDGKLWIVGRPGDEREYSFSNGLGQQSLVILTDVPQSVKALAADLGERLVIRDGLSEADFEALSQEFTDGAGFDDIVLLDPRSAKRVGQIARHIARRGTLNMIGTAPLDGLPAADLGRLHYDYIAFVGNTGPDIAASYGEARNRCGLRPGGSAVFVGAGGPMGQMHVQRAIEHPQGPQLIVATEVSDERLETLRASFAPLAQKNGRTLLLYNPANAEKSFYDFVMEATGGQGADDVVISVPLAKLMEEADTVLKPDGMLVLFAGVPIGTMGCLNLSNVYLHNAQYTGTSGLTIDDQASVMKRRLNGTLSPGRSVAAIGGLETAAEAIVAVNEGRYPGKIVIFPQIEGLPLMGLDELETKLPEVAAKLGEGGLWTNEAEQTLIEMLWKPPV